MAMDEVLPTKSSYSYHLTIYQTTKFSLVQIKRICRRQNIHDYILKFVLVRIEIIVEQEQQIVAKYARLTPIITIHEIS